MARMVGLALVVLVGVAGAQDLAALLAQGQAGGLSLEQVVGALRQRGMLDQVDPNLLRRIESRLGKNLVEEAVQVQDLHGRGRSREVQEVQGRGRSRLDRAREKALERQRNLFGTRPTGRPARPTRGPARNQLFQEGGQCQALKTENRLLKQKLVAQDEGQTTAIDVLRQLQGQGHFEEAPPPPPLEQLLAESSEQKERGGRVQVVEGRSVRSILITPTPTMSTIVNTLSIVNNITKNVTQDLNIFFAGRPFATHIIEQEVVVQTSTSLVSTTIEITPTPTWQTIVVTPTATAPPTPSTPSPDIQALLQAKEQERLALLAKIQSLQAAATLPQSFGGIRAEVVEIPEHPDQLETFTSLQQYLEQVRQQKVGGDNIVAQPLVAAPPSFSSSTPTSPTSIAPSTTVSTVFKSGSRPGEYSTSLVTITLGQEQARHRREVERGEVVQTRLHPAMEVELESSFSLPSPCEPATVTVTVTEAPASCLP